MFSRSDNSDNYDNEIKIGHSSQPPSSATTLTPSSVPLKYDYKFFTSGLPRQENEPSYKYHIRKLFTVKTLKSVNIDEVNSELKRTLGWFDLTMIGLGQIIGSGIFVLTGQAAATMAGPAVLLSFIFAGFTSIFAALSYCELASIIPIAGSTYTYAYVTIGEIIAWMIGWDLILEYLVGAAAVAVGWSGYFTHFFQNVFGIELSNSWTEGPVTFDTATNSFQLVPGAYFNLPAFTIVILLTILLIVGVKESTTVNNIVVSIKSVVLIIFIIAASFHINPDNYRPFIPPNKGQFSEFGFTGVLSATSVVFFAFVGFDSISTMSQETKNPQKNLPIGILLSFFIVIILYVVVCLMLTGVVSYTELNSPAPLSIAVNQMGLRWLAIITDIGAVVGLISVILVSLMGQPRIFYSMANDGLFFPNYATKIHPRFKTPYISTAFTGILCALIAAVFPIDVLAELTSIGTLFAFLIVNIGVIILRFQAPDLPRGFKIPGGPFFVPIMGSLSNIVLLSSATKAGVARLFAWMAVGFIVYFFYGRKHSRANNNIYNIESTEGKVVDNNGCDSFNDNGKDDNSK